MTSHRPPTAPDSGAPDLDALYHEGARAEPTAMLDSIIVKAARAELAGKAERRSPWWQRWLAPVSVAAVAVLGLSLSLQVADEDERRLLEERREFQRQERRDEPPAAPVPAAGDKAAAKVAEPAAIAVPAAPPALPAAPSPRPQRAPVHAAPASAAEAGAAAAPAAPAAAESSSRPRQEMLRDAVVEKDSADRRRANEGLAPPLGKLEARSLSAPSSAPAAATAKAAAPTAEAPTAEAWIRQIRELRSAGRNAEADASLARLRVAYPALKLPEDLM